MTEIPETDISLMEEDSDKFKFYDSQIKASLSGLLEHYSSSKVGRMGD